MPSASTPAADDGSSHEALLASLDIAQTPRPFRNPAWKPSARRNKNVKQIVAEAARREASLLATQNNSGAVTPGGGATTSAITGADGTGATTPNPATAGGVGHPPPTNVAQAAHNLAQLVLERNLAASVAAAGGGGGGGLAVGGGGPVVTYTNIESAPSLHPAHQRPYCDITGLPAPYTDPKTRLRYHDREVYGVVRSLSQGVAEQYLEARGAHVVLK